MPVESDSGTTPEERARALLALHRPDPPLLLPNAWDVQSARVFAAAGFPAIATTSAGIAWSLGYPDGEAVGRDEMLSVVARIAKSVRVPVTADLEAGFGTRPEAVADTVAAAVGAGAAGINLEDSLPGEGGRLLDVSLAVERLRAAREAAKRAGVHLVINARIDVYLHGGTPPAARLAETVRRARAYVEAGADAVFPIGVSDAPTIAALVQETRARLNVWARPGMPDRTALGRLGVCRISTATAPNLALASRLARLAADLLERGDFRALTPDLTYQDMQRLMS